MTPFSVIRDVPRRIESWPMIWKLLLCSTLSMTIAVVALAWYAAAHPSLVRRHTISIRRVDHAMRTVRLDPWGDGYRMFCAHGRPRPEAR